MIIVPAWIQEDLPEGIRAVLGSEPPVDAPAEWIPRECIKNCIYAPEGTFGDRRMAMIVFEEEKVPESLRSILRQRK
jgi:hypothetical protein